jgi:hypothetical protein
LLERPADALETLDLNLDLRSQLGRLGVLDAGDGRRVASDFLCWITGSSLEVGQERLGGIQIHAVQLL